MPTYCYSERGGDGTVYEYVFPMGETPREIELREGRRLKILERDYRAELVGAVISVRGGSVRPSKAWPRVCYASGVNASQAGELRKHLRDRGCPTEVTADGDPVYTSAAHERKALKVRGMYNKRG